MSNSVIDVLELLESNNSRLFKEEVLEQKKHKDVLHRVFSIVGDPYINFYVNKFKMPTEKIDADDDDTVVENFLDFITMSLATRSITGNAAKDVVISSFSKMNQRQQKWCLRILLKNMRCGVQDATVNKIWPGTINKFSVQLAESLTTRHDKSSGIVIEESIKFPVRVEPKLDGLRCIVVKKDGIVSMFTRSGSTIETLHQIKSSVENSSWDNFVLDSEVMGADWNESASVVMSHKKNKDDSSMILHVFDAMPFSDWKDQENIMPMAERIELVEELVSQVNQPNVKCVQGHTAKDKDELISLYSKYTNEGFEGIMIKDLSSPYIFKRSESVKKMKPVSTYEGMVVGHYTGNRGSKREGLWGGFEVVLPNGVVTNLGGGFTDALKAEISINPDVWVGKIVELEGQPDPSFPDGLTKDGKVRFPVFLRMRDERDVDVKVVEVGRAYLQRSTGSTTNL